MASHSKNAGKKDKYCIYHTVTILKCTNRTHRLIIGIRKREKDDEYPYSIEIQAIETEPRNPDSQMCSEIKENIYRILSDLAQTFTSCEVPFQVGYLCTKMPHSDLPRGHILLEKEVKGGVDCSKCIPVHVVEVKSIIGVWEGKRDFSSLSSKSYSDVNKQANIISKDKRNVFHPLTLNTPPCVTSSRFAKDSEFYQRAAARQSETITSNAYIWPKTNSQRRPASHTGGASNRSERGHHL